MPEPREHPMETARRALMEAARLEYEAHGFDDTLWTSLKRFAECLPNRAPIPVDAATPENVVALRGA
ncbi:MAG: hypothetical protein WKF94_03620 [Solirubrobacteraceae bacterium]